jgi:CubicO group peptidase (beta-lactamase class C family)
MRSRLGNILVAALALTTSVPPALAGEAAGAPAPAVPQAAAFDAAAAAAATDAFARAVDVDGFGVLLKRGEDVLYRRFVGRYDERTEVPIASATKWITGALVMTLVDAGRLDLDAPVKTWLPELGGAHGALTLRQLLSYTAGSPGLQAGIDLRQPRTLTLAESARAIAQEPLVAAPGTAFRYGGPDFQVAGAVVEQVAGEAWGAYFRRALGDPLGMEPFRWSNPQGPVPPEQVRNPVLQGGAVTTLDAYGAFLTMIANRGVHGGRRLLSEQAIAAMETVQTRGVAMEFVPPGAGDGSQYMLAHWCERESGGRCTLLSSPGAFGTYPWIDREHGLHGVVLIQDRLQRVAGPIRVLRDALIAAATPAAPAS